MIKLKLDQYEYPGIEEKLAENIKSKRLAFSTYCILQLSFGILLEKIAHYWNRRYSWTY